MFNSCRRVFFNPVTKSRVHARLPASASGAKSRQRLVVNPQGDLRFVRASGSPAFTQCHCQPSLQCRVGQGPVVCVHAIPNIVTCGRYGCNGSPDLLAGQCFNFRSIHSRPLVLRCLAKLAARLASSQTSLFVTRIIVYAFNRLSRRLAMGTRPGLLRGAVWTKRRCQKRISAKSSSRQPSNRRAGTSPLGTRHHQRMTCRLDGSGDQQSASIHDQRAVLRNFDTKYVASPCPICSDSYIFCSI